MRKYLSQKELARRWNFTVKTIQRWRAENKGPEYINFYGRVRYTPEAVREFEEKFLNEEGENINNYYKRDRK